MLESARLIPFGGERIPTRALDGTALAALRASVSLDRGATAQNPAAGQLVRHFVYWRFQEGFHAGLLVRAD